MKAANRLIRFYRPSGTPQRTAAKEMWAEHRLLPYIEAGQLIPLLGDWPPQYPGFFAYYRKQQLVPAALAAFIDQIRKR
jgi:DNA-binding transcriptional LysR family regulator